MKFKRIIKKDTVNKFGIGLFSETYLIMFYNHFQRLNL
jgi:hypothetical protein